MPVQNGKCRQNPESQIEEKGNITANNTNELAKTNQQTPITNIVDWEGDADPQKPMNWSNTRKAKNIVVICYVTFLTWVTN